MTEIKKDSNPETTEKPQNRVLYEILDWLRILLIAAAGAWL